MTRLCLQCGKPFAGRSDSPSLYCSRQCANTHIRSRSLAERFWEKVDRSGEGDACWLWIASRSPRGYGHFNVDGKQQRANRVAWQLAWGTIPNGMDVCHVCDNPSCVRNDDEGWYLVNGVLHPRRGHLWIGTKADNMADKIAKGRAHTKLNADAVRDVRMRLSQGESLRMVGMAHGVSDATILAIREGRTWNHLAERD